MILNIDTNFADDPRTLRFCQRLNDPNAGMHLIRLWGWAMQQKSELGQLDITPEDVARLAAYRGNPAHFWEALVACEFVRVADTGARFLAGWSRNVSYLKKLKRDARASAARRKRNRVSADVAAKTRSLDLDLELQRKRTHTPAREAPADAIDALKLQMEAVGARHGWPPQGLSRHWSTLRAMAPFTDAEVALAEAALADAATPCWKYFVSTLVGARKQAATARTKGSPGADKGSVGRGPQRASSRFDRTRGGTVGHIRAATAEEHGESGCVNVREALER